MTNEKSGLSPKALRKLRRRLENDANAKIARFWTKPRSAEQLDDRSRPVDRQAAKDLSHKKKRGRRP